MRFDPFCAHYVPLAISPEWMPSGGYPPPKLKKAKSRDKNVFRTSPKIVLSIVDNKGFGLFFRIFKSSIFECVHFVHGSIRDFEIRLLAKVPKTPKNSEKHVKCMFVHKCAFYVIGLYGVKNINVHNVCTIFPKIIKNAWKKHSVHFSHIYIFGICRYMHFCEKMCVFAKTRIFTYF